MFIFKLIDVICSILHQQLRNNTADSYQQIHNLKIADNIIITTSSMISSGYYPQQERIMELVMNAENDRNTSSITCEPVYW